MQVDERIAYLKTYREILVNYLDQKRLARDWHGVRDACVDIENAEAALHELERVS